MSQDLAQGTIWSVTRVEVTSSLTERLLHWLQEITRIQTENQRRVRSKYLTTAFSEISEHLVSDLEILVHAVTLYIIALVLSLHHWSTWNEVSASLWMQSYPAWNIYCKKMLVCSMTPTSAGLQAAWPEQPEDSFCKPCFSTGSLKPSQAAWYSRALQLSLGNTVQRQVFCPRNSVVWDSVWITVYLARCSSALTAQVFLIFAAATNGSDHCLILIFCASLSGAAESCLASYGSWYFTACICATTYQVWTGQDKLSSARRTLWLNFCSQVLLYWQTFACLPLSYYHAWIERMSAETICLSCLICLPWMLQALERGTSRR